MKKILFCLLVLFGLIATLNLWHTGYPITHDGDVHLIRLTNFYQSLSEGIFIPRWAANVNWGYGQPIFEFFYPLPSYLASLLHFLGLSFADSLKLLLGLSIVGSGITMYLWLRRLSSNIGSFFGAFLYMYAPYRFVDVYVRGDVGESLALVFVPLILYFLSFVGIKKSKYPVLLSGIFLALLILCHNIVSLVSLPFILFYGIYLWLENKKKKEILIKFVISIAIGFLLSSFFWLPGLFEAKYTLKDIVTKGEYASRFVSLWQIFYGPWSYGGTGSFTVQLGIVQWVVVGLSLFLYKFTKLKLMVVSLIIYTAASIFLMLPVSNFVWSKILLLQNFQFPWRFLIVTIFSTSVLGAILIDNFPRKIKIGFVIFAVIVCFIFQYQYMHAKAYEKRPDNTYAGIFKGPADTGESSPIWGIRFMESGYKNPLEVLSGKAVINQTKRTTIRHEYVVDAKVKSRLLENTLYFPGWNIYVDNTPVNIEFQDEMHRGVMTFWVTPGKHSIVVKFEATKFRRVADLITLISIIVVLILFLPFPKKFKI
ncbi:MAG TPA: 6-pyruvoyl-tetrahydropterin synthase-related protein [Patescibacteria group bacterium]